MANAAAAARTLGEKNVESIAAVAVKLFKPPQTVTSSSPTLSSCGTSLQRSRPSIIARTESGSAFTSTSRVGSETSRALSATPRGVRAPHATPSVQKNVTSFEYAAAKSRPSAAESRAQSASNDDVTEEHPKHPKPEALFSAIESERVFITLVSGNVSENVSGNVRSVSKTRGPGASARRNASGAANGVPAREMGSSPRNAGVKFESTSSRVSRVFSMKTASSPFHSTPRGTRPPRGGCGWKNTATRAFASGRVGSAEGAITFFSETAGSPNSATPNVKSIHLGKRAATKSDSRSALCFFTNAAASSPQPRRVGTRKSPKPTAPSALSASRFDAENTLGSS